LNEYSPCYMVQKVSSDLFEGLELEELEDYGFEAIEGPDKDGMLFLKAQQGFPFDYMKQVVSLFQNLIKRSGGKVPYLCIEGAYATGSGEVYPGSHGGFALFIQAGSFELMRTGSWLVDKMREAGAPTDDSTPETWNGVIKG